MAEKKNVAPLPQLTPAEREFVPRLMERLPPMGAGGGQ